MKTINVEIGDLVWHGGYGGFCHNSQEVVEDITVLYDQKTGEKYNVIHITGGQKFDSRDGGAMTPPTAYCIKEL